VPYRGVPVGTIKRHVTGRGNADKAAVLAAVRALAGSLSIIGRAGGGVGRAGQDGAADDDDEGDPSEVGHRALLVVVVCAGGTIAAAYCSGIAAA